MALPFWRSTTHAWTSTVVQAGWPAPSTCTAQLESVQRDGPDSPPLVATHLSQPHVSVRKGRCTIGGLPHTQTCAAGKRHCCHPSVTCRCSPTRTICGRLLSFRVMEVIKWWECEESHLVVDPTRRRSTSNSYNRTDLVPAFPQNFVFWVKSQIRWCLVLFLIVYQISNGLISISSPPKKPLSVSATLCIILNYLYKHCLHHSGNTGEKLFVDKERVKELEELKELN